MTFWEGLRNSSLIRRNMGKKYVGPEKRKYQRIESPLFIFYRLKDSNTYETSKAITPNIGSGGLMFEIDRPILQGRTLDVEIYLPSIKHNELIFMVFALAKVKWTTQIDIADNISVRLNVMLNLFQHLIKSICYETLKQVQGDK